MASGIRTASLSGSTDNIFGMVPDSGVEVFFVSKSFFIHPMLCSLGHEGGKVNVIPPRTGGKNIFY
jgi:hypothetical protein